MTHLTGTTSGTGTVPVAAPASNAAAIEQMAATLQSLTDDVAAMSTTLRTQVPVVEISDSPPASPVLTSAAAAPTPSPTPAATTPAPVGFHTRGPWVAGALYTVVPSGPLLPIAEPDIEHGVEGEEAPRWYAITSGLYVGVTSSHPLATHAVVGVRRSGMKGYGTQALALAAFNDFLRYNMVTVVPHFLAIVSPYLAQDPLPDVATSSSSNDSRLPLGLFLTLPFVPHLNLTLMTALDENDIVQRFTGLRVDATTSATPPPRTPSPRPPPYTPHVRHTLPAVRTRTLTTSPSARPSPQRLYHVQSPAYNGYTSEWSTAGAATQGVPGATVHAISSPQKKKKKKGPPPKAYVAFCGTECGVRDTWAEIAPLVLGVSGSIYRGYPSRPEADAAYDYAHQRSWTRVLGRNGVVTPFPTLPQPVDALPNDVYNPLNGNETLDDYWYVVFRGVSPGVYRSHLECQLNTLGIKGATHQVIEGKTESMAKFAEALGRGDVAVITPAYRNMGGDPFL
ncbi:hypothetical protein DFH06DRAFT_1338201 [Mycena polygramma]|nr:hypothetical protein DFH06DRAFT_1338201 [Mycena polygramma]